MKCTDCPLCFVLDVVFTCITLHNICILSKDAFDKSYIEKDEKELQNWLAWSELRKSSKLRGKGVSLKKVRGIIKSLPNIAIPIAQGCEDVKVESFLIRKDGGDEDLLHKATNYCITFKVL